jgi:hypothetical protein
VAGVNLGIHDEKSAGGAEVPWECKMQSGECRRAINGSGREKAPAVARLWRGKQKAQKQSNCFMAPWRDYAIAPGFSRSHLMGKRHGQRNDWQRNGAPLWAGGAVEMARFEMLSAAINGDGREKKTPTVAKRPPSLKLRRDKSAVALLDLGGTGWRGKQKAQKQRSF